MSVDEIEHTRMLITAGFLGVWLLGGCVLLIIAWVVARVAARVCGGVFRVFGDNVTTRLISLGVASLCFPRALPELLSSVLGCLRAFLGESPEQLMVRLISATEQMDSQSVNETLGALGSTFIVSLSRACSDGVASLGQMPLNDMVQLAAVAALVGLLLQLVSADVAPGGFVPKWIAWFKSLPGAARQNIAFFFLLGVAGYLSIAAMAAIPALREPVAPSEEVGVEKLKEQLENVWRGSETNFAFAVEGRSPFSDFEIFLQSAEEGIITGGIVVASGTAPANVGENLVATGRPVLTKEERFEFAALLDGQRRERDAAVVRHRKLVEDICADSRNALSAAVTSFQINSVDRKGRREAAAYFLDLVEWFRRKVNQSKWQVGASLAEIDQMDANWTRLAGQIMSLFPRAGHDRERTDLILLARQWPLSFRPQANVRAAFFDEQMPERRALGSYLGPFSPLASWLLQAESLPLALVVGMMGFGLLGAACSSFVRERPRRESNQPFVSDLPGVVIRGLSAAILVFLAVEGGLAVFASGVGEPNPYVLLLACLVASVFSEAVWERAHKRLVESLGSAPGQKQ